MNDSLWKRRAVILLLLVFLLTGCFARLKAPELNPEMAGFSGINWGTPLAEVKGKLKAKGENKERNLKWFSSTSKVFLGNIPLNEVSYLFEKDKFIAVTSTVKGKEDCQKIKEFLIRKLGKPGELKGDACTWSLPHSLVLFLFGLTVLPVSAKVVYFYDDFESGLCLLQAEPRLP